eukprot:8127317-Pyramimonas_sp.AAC.1
MGVHTCIPPAFWATGGLMMSFFPLPQPLLPLREGACPSPLCQFQWESSETGAVRTERENNPQ